MPVGARGRSGQGELTLAETCQRPGGDKNGGSLRRLGDMQVKFLIFQKLEIAPSGQGFEAAGSPFLPIGLGAPAPSETPEVYVASLLALARVKG